MAQVRVDVQTERLEFADGSKYAVRDGYAELPDAKAGLAQRANVAVRRRHAFRSAADVAACACGFAAWPWQARCPRCGAGLKGA